MTAAPSSPSALTDQLEETWASILALGRALTDNDWSTPTACPGWDVHAHMSHIIGTESMLAGQPGPDAIDDTPAHVRNDIGRANEAWIASLKALAPAELLARLEEVTRERLRQLRAMTGDDFAAPSWTPVGQATYGRFMQIRVFDCWVHEQDIRHAVGRPGHQSGPAAEQAIDEIERALGYVVGKLAGAPSGSRIRFELTGPVSRQINVAVNGRAAVVDALDGAPDAGLESDSTTFAALACGRIPGEPVPPGVVLEGDQTLARRLVGHLAFTI